MPIQDLLISDRGYVLETGKSFYQGTGKELASSEEVRKAYLGGKKVRGPF